MIDYAYIVYSIAANITPDMTTDAPQTSIQSEEPVLPTINNLMTFEETVGEEDVSYDPQKRDDDQNPFIDPKVGALLERPFLLDQFEWQNSQVFESRLAKLDIVTLWLTQPKGSQYPMNILKKFRYMAMDFKVRVQVQSTMMHYGKLLVAWLPCTHPGNTTPSTRSLFALDVNFIDASQPKVLELTIPYMYPLKWWATKDFMTTNPMTRGPSLIIDVLAPLGNAQSATASVPVSIYVSAFNVRAAGPVVDAAQTQPTHSFYQSEISGDIKIRERGYVRSAIDSVPTFVSIKQVAPMGQTLEEDSSVRLSLAASTTADVSKNMVQALLPEEHNIVNVCRRPVCYPMLSLDATSKGNIGEWLVHPSFYKIPSVGDVLTNMNVVTRMATYWHGSMKFAFSFSMAHVSTMRVAVILDYGATAGTSNTDDHVAAVWDITGSATKTVEVPYLSIYPYIPCFNGTWELDIVNPPSYGVPWLRLVVLNPLTSGSVSTVSPKCYINVFASVGEDFRMFIPRGFDKHYVDKFAPSFDQDNLGEIFKSRFTVMGTNGTDVQLPEYNFGEEFIDIMDLLTRYHLIHVSGDILTRSVPKPYKFLYRFMRYGNRYKVFDGTLSRHATYQYRPNPDADLAPFDLVPGPTDPVVQVELPFYEAWYYDLPQVVPTATIKVEHWINRMIYQSLSADSVLSFWTFASYFANTPPSEAHQNSLRIP